MMYLSTLLALATVGSPQGLAAPSAAPSAAPQMLPLNSATAEQFSSLPGVDEATATAIVQLRGDRGQLNSVEELRSLGLHGATLDALRSSTSIEVVAASDTSKTYKTVDDVMAAFSAEPTVLDVQRMAMEYTHTNRDQVERWLRASQNAAILPELKLRYTYDTDRDVDYAYISGNDEDFEFDQGGQDWGQDYRVEMRWRLDELVMSSERIRVISEAQDVVKLRDKVLGEATRIYFDRRRLQTDLLLSPPSDLKSQVEDQLRLMELTAELDAYTGGQFSGEL